MKSRGGVAIGDILAVCVAIAVTGGIEQLHGGRYGCGGPRWELQELCLVLLFWVCLWT